MARDSISSSVPSDILESLRLVFQLTWHRNLSAWLFVPGGVLSMLLACFGVSSLLGLSTVHFPASVACLILLFLGLLLCDAIVGDRKTKALVAVIEMPAGFCLRYFNIFFVPSFVLLPLSGPIGGAEVGKIIALFLIGFAVVMVATAYLTRGIQLVLGTSKRAMVERAEEMGTESDGIPLAETQRSSPLISPPHSNPTSGSNTPTVILEDLDPIDELIAPARTQDPSLIRGTGGPPQHDHSIPSPTREHPPQSPLPLTRPQRWAASMNANFDCYTYLVIFTFIGLPIYYASGYAMPAQLSITVLLYHFALSLPPKWRQVLHPVLITAAITIPAVWILGLIRGNQLSHSLHAYKTGTSYLDIWHGGSSLPAPGAGDILVSVLDAGIVALALPMFHYRLELKRHFLAIIIPNVSISIASLFGYPWVAYAMGISSTKSLAFAARSLTLALATPVVENINGDTQTVAALAIMSGIFGALVGTQMLDWLRIPDDDYVTRGITLGGIASAIATAKLLQTDPRAAALSSLSMSLFGIITLTLTSIPAVVDTIDSLVDLKA